MLLTSQFGLDLYWTTASQAHIRLKRGGPSHVQRGECSPRQVAFLSFYSKKQQHGQVISVGLVGDQPRGRFCTLHALCIAREAPRLQYYRSQLTEKIGVRKMGWRLVTFIH